jgi:hypothetical protein
MRKYLEKIPGWAKWTLIGLVAIGTEPVVYRNLDSLEDIEPAAVPGYFPVEQLKITDESMGYYTERGRVIAPVSIFDLYPLEVDVRCKAIHFKHVVDKGECYGVCVEMDNPTCVIRRNTIDIRLSDEEYKDLKSGKRVCAIVRGLIEKETGGRELREAWPPYIVCFELSQNDKLVGKSE